MSVLFVSAIDFTSKSSLGISSKAVSQARAAAEAGHDVFISKDYGRETRIERPLSGDMIASHSGKSGSFRKRKYEFLRDWVVASGIEAVVVRFDHLDRVFCSFSKTVRSKGVIVAVEFPTFPFDQEMKARHKKLLVSRKYLHYLAHRVYARIESRRAKSAPKYFDYAITYLEDSKIWGVPNISYDNGIDLSSIPLRSVREPDGEIRLIAVAKFAPHHGIDRLIRGLAQYKGFRSVHVTLVGTGAELPFLKHLVRECSIEDLVTFAGVAVGDDLDSQFDIADIAVGSLGLHRIGIVLGSTMKAREYCARGIPFVYSFPEKGFKGDERFALMLSNNDTPINIDAVVSFADEMIADSSVCYDMRRFAEEHFDWKVQMDKVLTVLESAVESKKNV